MPHDLMNLGLPTDLVAETAVRAAGAVAFTEGPAVDAEGSVFFSDIVNNRIMKRAPDGALSVWRADSGRANGNMFDAQGRLVSAKEGIENMFRAHGESGWVDEGNGLLFTGSQFQFPELRLTLPGTADASPPVPLLAQVSK